MRRFTSQRTKKQSRTAVDRNVALSSFMSQKSVGAESGLVHSAPASDTSEFHSDGALVHVSQIPNTDIASGTQRYEVVISHHVVSTAAENSCRYSVLFVQLKSQLSQLAELHRQLNTTAGQLLKAIPAVGSCLLAYWPENNNAAGESSVGGWFRAVVIAVDKSGDLVQLFFIDYGNTDEWRSWRNCCYLPQNCAQLPAVAIPCRLSSVKWLSAGGKKRQLQLLLIDSTVEEREDEYAEQKMQFCAVFCGEETGDFWWCRQHSSLSSLARCHNVDLFVNAAHTAHSRRGSSLRVADLVNAVDRLSSSQVDNQLALRHLSLLDFSVYAHKSSQATGMSSQLAGKGAVTSDASPNSSESVLCFVEPVKDRMETESVEIVDEVEVFQLSACAGKAKIAVDSCRQNVANWLSCHHQQWQQSAGDQAEPLCSAVKRSDVHHTLPAAAVSGGAFTGVLSFYHNLQLEWHSRPVRSSALQLCRNSARHDLQLVNVSGVRQFFIAVAGLNFDQFQRRLHSIYDRLPPHPRQLNDSCLALGCCAGSCGDGCVFTPGSYWVARWDDDSTAGRQWGRVLIVDPSNVPVCHPNSSRSSLVADKPTSPRNEDTLQVLVFWVDYGEFSWLSACQLRPITVDVASQSVFITAAMCADIVDKSTVSVSRVRERFLELVDLSDSMFVGGDSGSLRFHTVRDSSSDQCLAVVLWHRQSSTDKFRRVADILLNEELPVAVLPVIDDTQKSPIGNTRSAAVRDVSSCCSTDTLDSLCFSEDSERLRLGGSSAARGRQLLTLPAAGQLVYVRVTSFRSGRHNHLHVALPFGTHDAAQLARVFSESNEALVSEQRASLFHQLLDPSCSLDGVSAALRRFYGESAAPRSNTRWHCGQLVAVKWRHDSWQRARLSETPGPPATGERGSDGARSVLVRVHLVDWGRDDSVPLHRLRPLARQFCRQPPYQAVMCRLACVGDKTKLSQRICNVLASHKRSGQFLLAHVIAVDGHHRCVTLDLYCADGSLVS